MNLFKKMFAIFVIVLLFLSNQSTISVFGSENLDYLFIDIGDAIMKTKDADWSSVQESLNQFEKDWTELKSNKIKETSVVEKAIATVKSELSKSDKDPELIGAALSSLSKALSAYNTELNPVDKEAERAKLKDLFPYLDQLEKSIKIGDLEDTKIKVQQLLTKWTSNEVIVRNQSVAAYGQIETQFAYLRIALSQSPPDMTKALNSAQDMRNKVENFINGKSSTQTSGDNYSLGDITSLLDKSKEALNKQDHEKASEFLNQILLVWPAVEAEVRTKDHRLYTSIENEIPEAISLLNSKEKNIKNAYSIVDDLDKRLQLLSNKTSYSYIDALLILLREGLEALLIITGLLAFLKKTNHHEKQVWIWSGVFGGLLGSVILAIIMNLFFNQLSAASSREYMEGIVGIVAVVMMLTVGAWLHKKTNIAEWNRFVKKNLGNAVAKGSLFSMALLSFLSIFREGAETIIFYAGMAPSIETSQMVLGIMIALFILMVLGVIIIRYSAVIPMRPFFVIATLLIYLLSLKMIGVSIHALQVANSLPIHSISKLPYIEGIGFFPTWETIIPQILLIIVIFSMTMYFRNETFVKNHIVMK